MTRQRLLTCVAGVLAAVLATVFGWRWFSAPRTPSPEKLAQVALTGSPGEQAVAAAQLTSQGEAAVPHMRRVLAEAKTPEIRARMIQGLSLEWDFESMPAFLAGMDDESLLVRVRSAAAVERVLGSFPHRKYNPRDPPEQRRAAIEFLRECWSKVRANYPIEQLKARVKGKDYNP